MFKISYFLYLKKFWKNYFFKLKIDFEKYGFLFNAKFLYHKNSSNSLQYVWFLVIHICYSNILHELIFVEFIGFYWRLNDQVFSSKISAGSHWQSTGPVVGRSDRSTDVHEMCTKEQPCRLVDCTVDRLKAPNSRVLPVDRAVDRRHNGQKYDR